MTSKTNILTKIIAPILLLLIAGAIIFYKFPHIPQNLNYDEAEFIDLSRSLEHTQYTPYSQLATGHATLYFYILLASLKIFGNTIFAVRLPSAVFGVLDVILLYYIFRFFLEKIETSLNKKFPGINLSFILAFIFATSRWYFNFARFGFEASTVLFFEFAGILSYLIYRKNNNNLFLILTGIATGLAYNSYTPGRIFFLLILALIGMDFVNHKIPYKKMIIKSLFVILPFIILVTPISLYFTRYDDNRIYEQFFLKSEKLSIQEKSTFLWQNIVSISGMFFIKGDMNGRHNYPGKSMLNPLIGLLFIVGLGLSIKNWKNKNNLFFLLYFAIGILPPLMTYPWENPNALRSITALPAIIYFAGRALVYILKLPFSKKYIYYVIISFIMFSSIYEIRTYFIFQRLVFPNSFTLPQDSLRQYLDGELNVGPREKK